MSNRITFIGTVVFLLLHLFAGEASGQNRIDSIEAEVKALNKSYNEQLKVLYHELLEISHNPDTNIIVRLRAKTMFHLFPIDENINRLIDSIDHEMFDYDEGFKQEYPYFHSLSKIMFNGMIPHLSIMDNLSKPLNDETLFLYSLLFRDPGLWFESTSLDNKEQAECLRIIANSYYGRSNKKQNLLEIAEILEKR
jgi:hypothetical protein